MEQLCRCSKRSVHLEGESGDERISVVAVGIVVFDLREQYVAYSNAVEILAALELEPRLPCIGRVFNPAMGWLRAVMTQSMTLLSGWTSLAGA